MSGGSLQEEIIREQGRDLATGEQFPTSEPFMSQVDNNIINLISYYSMPSEGSETDPPYPDMKKYIMILTHLNRTSSLTREQAIQSYFMVKNSIIETDRIRYAGDDTAISVLDAILHTVWMICFGDAQGGRRQGFLSRMVGSIRGIEVMNPAKEGKPWWRL